MSNHPIPSHDSNAGSNDATARRLDFMQFDADDAEHLRSLKPLIEKELPNGLDKFYRQLRKTPDVGRFFSSDEHVGRAKGAQLGHWANISNAKFDGDYARKVRTIGATHARIGLEPTWYIGGYAIIADHLITSVVSALASKGGMFSRAATSPETLGKALSSLIRAMLLDMDLAISVYIEEAEAAKQKAQAEAIASERQLVMDCFGKAMAAIAAKDLSYRLQDNLPEAYKSLGHDFNHALEQLGDVIGQINSGALQIRSSAVEILSASDDLARRTAQQAASVEETAAALEEITATVKDSSHRAEEAGRMVGQTANKAESSGNVVRDAVSAMGAIESSSNEIASIIGVIDEIAFQTNLLALNAGVEAARAGDAGKGFAVVAQEVRELAQRSASAAREIKTLITSSGNQVKSGVQLVRQAGEALFEISKEINNINHNISSIVDASKEQSTALQEVNRAVNSMDEGTQKNAAMVEQTTAATHSLAHEVDVITGMLASFRTDDDRPASSAIPMRKRA